MSGGSLIVVEDDPFTRLIPIILDPKSHRIVCKRLQTSCLMTRVILRDGWTRCEPVPASCRKPVLQTQLRSASSVKQKDGKLSSQKPASSRSRKHTNREVDVIAKLLTATAIAVVGCLSSLASAQTPVDNYPDRNLRIVVPFAAGGGVDVLTRIIAQRLSVLYGKPVIVENQVGATGLNAVQYVGAAPNDGYTLLVGSPTPFSVLPALRTNLPFNNLSDFIPITLFGTAPGASTINPAIPAKSIPSWLRTSRQIRISSLLVTPDLAGFRICRWNFSPNCRGRKSCMFLIGARRRHFPMSSRGTFMASSMRSSANCLPFSRVRFACSAYRSNNAPRYSRTCRRLMNSCRDMNRFSWIGIFAAPGTSPEIVKKLHADVRRIIEEPEVRQRMTSHAITPDGRPPEAFRAFINADIERWRNVGKVGQIKVD